MKILIVDDDLTSRNILSEMLKQFGFATEATTGTEAMDFVSRSLNSDTKFDVICLDLKLPGRSGQDVLRFIRSAEKRHEVPPTPVFIITSDNTRTSVMETSKDGCNGYLLKPFDWDHLNYLLKREGLLPLKSAEPDS